MGCYQGCQLPDITVDAVLLTGRGEKVLCGGNLGLGREHWPETLQKGALGSAVGRHCCGVCVVVAEKVGVVLIVYVLICCRDGWEIE